MRTYIPEEKREYEKMYEATTGKVSHKILIELDPEQEAFIREIADYTGESMSEVATKMVAGHIEGHLAVEHMRAIDREQK